MSDNTDAPVKVSDRRSVVKTAAHLAWAIPAVQIAAAAPALAASGTPTPAAFSVAGSSTTSDPATASTRNYTGAYTVSNTGQTAGSPSVTVTIHGVAGAPTTTSPAWTGAWTYTAKTTGQNAQPSKATATLTYGNVAGGTAASNLTFTFAITKNETLKDITVAVAPPGSSASTGQTGL